MRVAMVRMDKRQVKRLNYYKSPKRCKNCNTVIEFERKNNTFCSKHCQGQSFHKKSKRTSKVCKSCKEEKSIKSYYFANVEKTRYATVCKKCSKRIAAEHNRNNKNRKFIILKCEYGITKEEWFDLYNKYNGKCFICKIKKATDVDHCHKTNVIRGMLCNSCNLGLGSFRDNIIFLENAVSYLKGNI